MAILRLYEATFMLSAWNCQTQIKNSVHTVTQLPPPEAAPTDVQGYIHRKDVYNVHRWNLNSQMFKDAHMEQMSNACYTMMKNMRVCMKNAALVNHMGLYEGV